MWKSVTRRIRDTFERSANHIDRRSTTVVTNANTNIGNEKNKHPCSEWFASRKCWQSFKNDKDAKSKKAKFEHLNRNWTNAITWSGVLILGWSTSQLIHLKLKYQLRTAQRNNPTANDLLSAIYPYFTSGNKDKFCIISGSEIKKLLPKFIPTVHLVSNDHEEAKDEKSEHSSNSTNLDSSNDLGEVLNSIENKLGLAAIENGHYQDGLSLLRSAASRNYAPAIYNLGLCYENGFGVTVNEKMALELYKSAAAMKHPGALYNLGIFYGQGRGGLKSDEETATRLLKLAAVQGQQDAIDALSKLDVPASEPPRNDMNIWSYQFSPFVQNDNIIPTHSSFYVNYLNYTEAQKCSAAF